MFRRLVREWVPGRGLSPAAVAEKVKRFFFFYAANRHKAREAPRRMRFSPIAFSISAARSRRVLRAETRRTARRRPGRGPKLSTAGAS